MSTPLADHNARIIAEFRANRAQVAGNPEGMQLLLLQHTGARSGETRVNPLAYLAYGVLSALEVFENLPRLSRISLDGVPRDFAQNAGDVPERWAPISRIRSCETKTFIRHPLGSWPM